MASKKEKQPYIPFYLGDYLKDTRILPLNVRGGWVDLLLFMWNNDPKGELTGTMEDFSRVMSCSMDEAILVIQTLRKKEIFDYHDDSEGTMTLISRKQKKMVYLSEIRKKVGKNGGNPQLKVKKGKVLVNQKGNQRDNLNPEYEYDNDTENKKKKEGGEGGGKKSPVLPLFPESGKFNFDTTLPAWCLEAVERNQFTMTKAKNTQFIRDQWEIFVLERANDPPTDKAQYQRLEDLTRYFTNWMRNKKPEKNGTNIGRGHRETPTSNGGDPTVISREGVGKL